MVNDYRKFEKIPCKKLWLANVLSSSLMLWTGLLLSAALSPMLIQYFLIRNTDNCAKTITHQLCCEQAFASQLYYLFGNRNHNYVRVSDTVCTVYTMNHFAVHSVKRSGVLQNVLGAHTVSSIRYTIDSTYNLRLYTVAQDIMFYAKRLSQCPYNYLP